MICPPDATLSSDEIARHEIDSSRRAHRYSSPGSALRINPEDEKHTSGSGGILGLRPSLGGQRLGGNETVEVNLTGTRTSR